MFVSVVQMMDVLKCSSLACGNLLPIVVVHGTYPIQRLYAGNSDTLSMVSET